jgi:DNA-binding NarL/FixJ family response regulator
VINKGEVYTRRNLSASCFVGIYKRKRIVDFFQPKYIEACIPDYTGALYQFWTMLNTFSNSEVKTRGLNNMNDDQGQNSSTSNAILRTGTKALRILVVDDHDIIRRGLKQLLTAKPGWEVCGEAKTGREAVSMAEQMKPDVVVMDISMPDLNGLEAARRIHKEVPKTGILILTMHFSDQLVREVVDSGARGYILKSDADKDLVSAVEAISNKRTFFTPRASEMLLDGFSRQSYGVEPKLPLRNRLTSREREIVQLLAEGKSSKEVAVALGISVKTAETHRANIMRKLELHSVSELVRYAIKNQIIEA